MRRTYDFNALRAPPVVPHAMRVGEDLANLGYKNPVARELCVDLSRGLQPRDQHRD